MHIEPCYRGFLLLPHVYAHTDSIAVTFRQFFFLSIQCLISATRQATREINTAFDRDFVLVCRFGRIFGLMTSPWCDVT